MHRTVSRLVIASIAVVLGLVAFAASGGPVGGDTPPPSATGKPEFVPDELLVKFRDGVTPAQAEATARGHGIAQAQKLRAPRKSPRAAIGRWWHVKLGRGQDAEAVMARLARDPTVEAVDLNYIVRTARIPNDPLFDELWGLHNTGQSGGRVDADIDAPEAWDLPAPAGDGVVTAVIDSGVDYTHPDLAASMWVNAGEVPGNGIDDDGNGYVDDVYGYNFYANKSNPFDDHGHGTHVAGTIAAVSDNGIGVAGVNPGTRIMAVKFLGAGGTGTVASATQAVVYATDMGARVLNNSWGGGGYSQALYDAILAANDMGVVFVAAAGNDGNNNDMYPFYPASYNAPNLISVAATTRSDLKAWFSNIGRTSVHVGAPGMDVLSTVPAQGSSCCSSPTGYLSLSGTSMAAPHVSGALSRLLPEDPDFPVALARPLLIATSDPLDSLAGVVAGGRLNLERLLTTHFAISARPVTGSVSVPVGGSQSVSTPVTVRSLFKGFSEPVTFTVVSPDPSITASVTPAVLAPPAYGSVSGTLTITTSNPTVRGTYELTVYARSASGEEHSDVVRLSVYGDDFAIRIAQPVKDAVPGGSASFTMELTSSPNLSFPEPITLSMLASDPGISGQFSASPVRIRAVSESAWLRVDLAAGTPLGRHSVTVRGQGGSIVRDVNVTVDVTDNDIEVVEVASVGAPDVVRPGDSIVVSDTTRNNALVSTNKPSETWFYISTEPVIGGIYQTSLGARAVPALGPQASDSGQITVKIPNSQSPGRYFILALAGRFGSSGDTNLGNNSRAGSTIFVAGLPYATPVAPAPLAATEANLKAMVYPNGDSTETWFEWGTSYTYGNVTPVQVVGSGTEPISVGQQITGLAAQTTYQYRVGVRNSFGTYHSYGGSFRTTVFPPVVVTGEAVNIAQRNATVSGSVNPNGEYGSFFWVEYGTDSAYGQKSTVSSLMSTGIQNVTRFIGGLNPNTTYHYRVVAQNNGGITAGDDRTVTTLPDPPVVVTGSASSVTRTSATLIGTVNPNGADGLAWFEYWAGGVFTKTQAQAISGSTEVQLSADLSGLSAGVSYSYKLVASNSGGTTQGADRSFKTISNPPVVVTGIASSIEKNYATLHGSVNPNGAAGTYWFEYGRDTTYGQASDKGYVSGYGGTSVTSQIAGLDPNTTYHYRLVAENNGGTSYGPDATFTTLPAPPIVTTGAATSIKTGSAVLNGTVDLNGDTSATVWFQYSTTPTFQGSMIPQRIYGTGVLSVSDALNGLASGTTYYFRLVAENRGGTSYGPASSFTTKGR